MQSDSEKILPRNYKYILCRLAEITSCKMFSFLLFFLILRYIMLYAYFQVIWFKKLIQFLHSDVLYHVKLSCNNTATNISNKIK